MKVFFTCSSQKISKHEKFYRHIRDEIISQGHQLTRDWIDYSINVAKRGTPDISSYSIYKDIAAAILTADVIIADATIKSMSLGHQITFAIQKEKPTLLLKYRGESDESEKLFIEGSDFPNLIVENYKDTNNINKILKRFFYRYESQSKKRFNLVLTEILDNYISWASFHYKKTKTEIIHDAVDKTSKNDLAYKNYLSRQS